MSRAEPMPRDLPLHVERVGSGDPLILLHGFGASRFTWRRWAGPLSSGFDVFLVDLRGFGASTRVDRDRLGPSEMAEDLCRLILEMDLERVTLLGHSMGGGVALLTALRLADRGEGRRVVRLVSIAGTAYAQDLPLYVGLLRRPIWAWVLRLVPARWLVRRVLEAIVHDPAAVTDEQVDGYAAPLLPWEAKQALVAAAAQLVPPDLNELVARYPHLDVPVLLLWGRQDRVVPLSIGERLVGELPRARLVVLEDCGHVPPEERPEESLRVVREFLEGTWPEPGVRA